MTVPTQVTDHTVQAQAALLSQFLNSPRIQAYVGFVGDEIQRAGDLAHQLLTDRVLAVAVGAQLDTLGKLVGGVAQWRLGLSDDDFRTLISVAIRINNSEAQAEDTTEIIGLLVAATVEYTQFDPAEAHYQWILENTNGPELITDGAMELAGIANWTEFQSTGTKEPGAPGGTGSQVIQIAYLADATGAVFQAAMTVGEVYQLTAWAIGDERAIPSISDGPTVHFTGTASATPQPVDVTFQADGGTLYLASTNLEPGLAVQFDDVSVKAYRNPANWLSLVAAQMERIVASGVAWELVEAVPGAFRFDSGPGFDQGHLAKRIL